MSTNLNNTFNALNGSFLNGETSTINEEYLNTEIILMIENVEELYNLLDSRRSPESIVWTALLTIANMRLEQEALPRKGGYASSYQLKMWLNEYGRDYESIAESVEHIREYQDELKAEK